MPPPASLPTRTPADPLLTPADDTAAILAASQGYDKVMGLKKMSLNLVF